MAGLQSKGKNPSVKVKNLAPSRTEGWEWMGEGQKRSICRKLCKGNLQFE